MHRTAALLFFSHDLSIQPTCTVIVSIFRDNREEISESINEERKRGIAHIADQARFYDIEAYTYKL